MNINEIYEFNPETKIELPFLTTKIPAGFPSPGDDYIDKTLDLNDLIKHPAATFIMRVSGDSMEGAGIFNGDLIIVDRAVKPEDGKIIVAALNGELIVKRLKIHTGRYFLVSENPGYKPFEVHQESDFEIHGVVIYSIRNHL